MPVFLQIGAHPPVIVLKVFFFSLNNIFINIFKDHIHCMLLLLIL